MIAVILILLAFFGGASAAEKRGDCLLNLFAYHLEEVETVRYCEGDRVLPEGMRRIESLFRSRDSGLIHPVDPRLVRLIDRIEDHFGVRQVEIISGYRSRAFNKELKATGHTVAGESLHTQGMAADIHLDEITEEDLRDYALSLVEGGVGFYPSLNMVHVDIGPVRTWGEPAPRKGWVGEKNGEVPLTLTVTPDRSLTKELDRITLRQEDPLRTVEILPEIALEFFDRGAWKVVGQLKTGLGCGRHQAAASVSLKQYRPLFSSLPYGKYRLRAEVCGGGFQSSNEFYFKKGKERGVTGS